MAKTIKTELERKKKSPAVRGLNQLTQEGHMNDKQRIKKHLDKILQEANERELRLITLAAEGILKK